MNFLPIILIVSCPFWVLDLGLRALDIAPPMWVGDAMASALILLGSGLMWKTFRAGKPPAPDPESSAAAQPKVAPGETPPQSSGKTAWEQSLPLLFHEIRNYSCSLRGNALLLRRQVLSEGVLEPLGRLERTVGKIESLFQDIMESASPDKARRSASLDVVELIKECILDHFPDSGAQFHVQAEDGVPALEGDPFKLERVFLNLFRNALEAGSTRIRVRLETVPGTLRILVEDNGQGCPGEEIAALFRPLYSTKKDKGGTGLGLYVAKAIVESHGGEIKAVTKNAWGGRETGMIFCLEFPVHPAFIATLPKDEDSGSFDKETIRSEVLEKIRAQTHGPAWACNITGPEELRGA